MENFNWHLIALRKIFPDESILMFKREAKTCDIFWQEENEKLEHSSDWSLILYAYCYSLLRQLPLTRAQSPKLGRRKSCSDAVNASPDEKGKVCARALRHSLGSLKEESNFSPKTKSPISAKSSGNRTSKMRDLRSQQDKETAKATVCCKIPEEMEMNAEPEVQS